MSRLRWENMNGVETASHAGLLSTCFWNSFFNWSSKGVRSIWVLDVMKAWSWEWSHSRSLSNTLRTACNSSRLQSTSPLSVFMCVHTNTQIKMQVDCWSAHMLMHTITLDYVVTLLILFPCYVFTPTNPNQHDQNFTEKTVVHNLLHAFSHLIEFIFVAK